MKMRVGLIFSELFLLLMTSGCFSSPWTLYRETEFNNLELPLSDKGLVGISISFSELPSDLVWEFQMRLRNQADGKLIFLRLPGQEIVDQNVSARVPLLFSLPSGRYQTEEIALLFPENSNDIYRLSQDRLVLAYDKPLPTIEIKNNKMIYLGDVAINQDKFVPGDLTHKTTINAIWHYSAPFYKNTWNNISPQLEVTDFGYANSGMPNKISLLVDEPSEGALATFASGFGQLGSLAPYALVVIGSQKKGVAIFEKGDGSLQRVASNSLGEMHLFSVIVTNKDNIFLRGFCFDVTDSEGCNRETTKVPKLTNEVAFKEGEIRFRGFMVFKDNSGSIIEETILPSSFEATLQEKIPFAVFRSFVFDEDVLRHPVGKFEFFTEKGIREKWDPSSLPVLEAIKTRAIECDSVLRKADPYITSEFEINFAVGSKGYLETKSQRGLNGAAFWNLKSCFDSELDKWKTLANAEALNGFGLKFKQ